MREAADMEDATEKAAVTPGPIKPARELLGEMLLQLKRPGGGAGGVRNHDEEGTEPLPGALRRGQAAAAAGQRQKASAHYATPVENARRAPIRKAARSWRRPGRRAR